MQLSEKLLQLRKKKGLSQREVAEAAGITRRAYIGYEAEGKHPKARSTYENLAFVLGCDLEFLLDENAQFVIKASDQYGLRGKQQAEQLVEQLSGLFAGGELSDADKDAVMISLQRAYFISKEINKKYTPKKYKKSADSEGTAD